MQVDCQDIFIHKLDVNCFKYHVTSSLISKNLMQLDEANRLDENFMGSLHQASNIYKLHQICGVILSVSPENELLCSAA